MGSQAEESTKEAESETTGQEKEEEGESSNTATVAVVTISCLIVVSILFEMVRAGHHVYRSRPLFTRYCLRI